MKLFTLIKNSSGELCDLCVFLLSLDKVLLEIQQNSNLILSFAMKFKKKKLFQANIAHMTPYFQFQVFTGQYTMQYRETFDIMETIYKLYFLTISRHPKTISMRSFNTK